jgi:hypothetical protein
MERIVDKLLIRYNPDEILDYILQKTAAFAKLNARISVITEKPAEGKPVAVPVAPIPIVKTEEKAEANTIGNVVVEGQKVEEEAKAEEVKKAVKKVVKKKAKEEEAPAAPVPSEEQDDDADVESEGSTIENGSKCKDPYKKKHFDIIQKRREELLAQGIEPEKELTIEKLKDCVENKRMTLSKVAEEFGCKDIYVSSLIKVNGIVPIMTKEKRMIVARGRGAM